MIGVRVEVRRFVDDGQPRWIECWLTDANGQEWTFVEKVPVVTIEELDAESSYPRLGTIACQIIERRIDADNREVVVIDTHEPWNVEATSGETRFIVRADQLEKFD